MKSRREFLKEAATGAVLLGAQSKLGLAAMLEQRAEAGKPKVVIARDAALMGKDGKPDEKRVLDLCEDRWRANVERWKAPGLAEDKRRALEDVLARAEKELLQ